MKLVTFIKAIDGHICNGADHMWGCYPDSRYLDIANIIGNEIGSCIFNTQDQQVYEVAINPDNNRAFRWIDPEFRDAHLQECIARGVNPNIAWDDVHYEEKNEDEILDLAHKVVHGTYVHSKPILPPDVMDPASVPEASPEPLGPEEYDEMYSDAAELLRQSVLEAQQGLHTDPPKEQFLVTATVKYVLDINADSMDEAANRANDVINGMKLVWNNDGVCFVDRYVSRTSVEKDHE